MYTAEELASSVTMLASPPLVYQQVRQVLDDPDSSMGDLVKVIAVDPGITARLLKLVNSSFYGFRYKVETVEKAVKMLGMQQVHDLALATSVAALFNGISPAHMNMAQFWHYSVYCGLAARAFADCCKLNDSERLFVEGLLCDIGHLVIYEKVPQLAMQAMEKSKQDGSPLFLIERNLIGCDYSQVGDVLLEGWNLPASLRNSVRYHTEPTLTSQDKLEVSLVHIARLMASAIDTEQPMEQVKLRVDADAWQSTGLKAEQIAEAHERADQDTLAVVNSLFSNMVKT